MGIEPTSDGMGISTVSWKVSAECWAQLGRKTPPLRYEFKESWRVRPTDSTGLMVGAVGMEPATLDSSITHLNSACITATQQRKR